MTPFEQAAYNVRQLAVKLNLYSLMIQTVKDTEELSPEDREQLASVVKGWKIG